MILAWVCTLRALDPESKLGVIYSSVLYMVQCASCPLIPLLAPPRPVSLRQPPHSFNGDAHTTKTLPVFCPLPSEISQLKSLPLLLHESRQAFDFQRNDFFFTPFWKLIKPRGPIRQEFLGKEQQFQECMSTRGSYAQKVEQPSATAEFFVWE